MKFLMMSLFVLTSCSEKTNFNQLFVSKKEKESLVSLITEAQIAYDNGEFSEALELAEKAEKLSPQNEEIAVLLGYINLSLAGMDTFQIAKALLEATTRETKASNKASLATSGQTSAAIFLETLADVLNISRSDVESLGSLEDDNDRELFKDLPVLLPLSAAKAREGKVGSLERIHLAIQKICPFVNTEAKTPEKDTRHSVANCPATTVKRRKTVVSHFLWAFAHIAEAAVFFSVMQYANDGADVSNIQARANAMEKSKDSLSLVEYATHATTLADGITKIYAVDDSKSQFSAIVNGITVASLAIAQIANVPFKIKRALERALTSINSATDKLGSNTDEKKANALKAQLNKKMAENLSAKITEAAASDPAAFAENKDDLCGAYTSITGSSSTLDACKDD